MGDKKRKRKAEEAAAEEEEAHDHGVTDVDQVAEETIAEEHPEVKEKKKKKKNKVVEEDEEENGEDIEENGQGKPQEEDYQKEFKVLGHQDFTEVKKIRVVSGWIKNAREFPAGIDSDNVGPLAEITPHLPKPLVKRIETDLKHWFPVQRAVIPELIESIINPPVLRRRDLAISAPTGSGKTLCYVLPILAAISNPGEFISTLIVVPVQALVKQIINEISRFNGIGAKVVGLSGSDPYDKERRKLVSSEGLIEADIIVATPSRLIEHILDPAATFDLSRLRYIIADEADRMLNVRQEWLELVEGESGGVGGASSIMDFAMRRNAPQKILLSATLSRDIEQLEKWNLHRPRLFRASAEKAEQVDTSAECVLPSGISHVVMETPLKFHPLVLFNDIVQSECKRILVFTNHNDSSVRLCKLLSILADGSFQVEQLTADLYGKRRHKVLERFKKGTTRVLICSDYLSRGVDVEGIDCVVNYDLPQATRLFIHRAGRTARAGNKGRLVSITEKELKRMFVKLLKKGNLWNDASEKKIEEEELEESKEKYTKALEKMKKEMEDEKKDGGKDEKKENGKIGRGGGNGGMRGGVGRGRGGGGRGGSGGGRWQWNGKRNGTNSYSGQNGHSGQNGYGNHKRQRVN
ncbi:hypothetical protein PENTCL1PPCAC_11237 [Pristionchus entomophagus]|uniref:ATP-dependent RNA helicase n=1 Tax=Pristionchus entomophagus TaxID=358040 RepID=A0AAV5T242_9BILA|nr:hypothetical protein PENTCL1PPCAC_11237 [Pristionchus entomophagus]